MKPGRASPLVGHFEEGDEFIFEFVGQSQPILTLLLLQYALDEHGQQLLLLYRPAQALGCGLLQQGRKRLDCLQRQAKAKPLRQCSELGCQSGTLWVISG